MSNQRDLVFYNGDILPMAGQQVVEAVLVRDGKIHSAGSFDEIMSHKRTECDMVNLRGKAMLPAFIDPHSHLTSVALTLRLAPLASASSFDDVIHILSQFKKDNHLKDGDWIVGFGYDHNNLKEHLHPTKDILDKVSTSNPILISHVSGHMGCMNSAALETAGITSDTPNPSGGVIGRIGETREPNGYLEENAFISMTTLVPEPSLEELSQLIVKAQEIYFSFGIATIQEGLIKENQFHILNYAAQSKKLKADVIGYVDLKESKHIFSKHPEYDGKYENGLKLAGYKIFLDGSPQGKTAWLSAPYASSSDGYRGYPIYSDEEVLSFCETALRENRQLLAHCNGDAAAEQFISCMEKASAGCLGADIRPVMIHAQTVRPDQLERMKRVGMLPSFFIAHTYYWGDIHLKNLGRERAEAISPAQSAKKINLPFTFHQDTPVLPPNMMETVWCAVNRRTQSGRLLGEKERISVLDALKAVTIYAAYQYGEDAVKGSIEEGKVADLVILDQNPLKICTDDLKRVQVLSLYKRGELVFEK